MLLASALVLTLSAGPQAATQTSSSAAQPDTASLERIKQSISTPSAVKLPEQVQLVPEKKKAPTFRVLVEEKAPPPPWEEQPVVPLYVRTQRPAYHHEYLMMVTPEAFRAGTLYPGMDVLPALQGLFENIGDELQQRREAQAKRKVRKELEGFKLFISQ